MLGEFREFIQRGKSSTWRSGHHRRRVRQDRLIGGRRRVDATDRPDHRGVDFKSLKLAIGGAPEAPVTINYGMFLQTTIDFLIIAFCVFLLVKR